MKKTLLLAPLRGVTIRAFRDVFSNALNEYGFTGAIAPFIPANPGIRYTRKLFADILPNNDPSDKTMPLIPQVIGKDSYALREWCKMVKDIGFQKADLNAGCPFPMIRKKGRGAGLLQNPDRMEKLLEVGCDEMGAGNFSLKTRLGLERSDELINLIPIINRYPLAFLTVHARTAKQMYDGTPNHEAFQEIESAASLKVIYNGDASVLDPTNKPIMVGRDFIRKTAKRPDARELLARYLEISRGELCGEASVLGRMKELLSYWCLEPEWKHIWSAVKICRNINEFASVCRI